MKFVALVCNVIYITFTLSLKIESNYRTTNSLGATNRCRFHIPYRLSSTF